MTKIVEYSFKEAEDSFGIEYHIEFDSQYYKIPTFKNMPYSVTAYLKGKIRKAENQTPVFQNIDDAISHAVTENNKAIDIRYNHNKEELKSLNKMGYISLGIVCFFKIYRHMRKSNKYCLKMIESNSVDFDNKKYIDEKSIKVNKPETFNVHEAYYGVGDYFYAGYEHNNIPPEYTKVELQNNGLYYSNIDNTYYYQYTSKHLINNINNDDSHFLYCHGFKYGLNEKSLGKDTDENILMNFVSGAKLYSNHEALLVDINNTANKTINRLHAINEIKSQI